MPPKSEKSTLPRRRVLFLLVRTRSRSEHRVLLVWGRGGALDHLDVPALFGAAPVDEDAAGGKGGLKALETV